MTTKVHTFENALVWECNKRNELSIAESQLLVSTQFLLFYSSQPPSEGQI